MSRRIGSTKYHTAAPGQQQDGYFDRLIKYIPADVVGLWLVGAGVINTFLGSSRGIALVLYFVACLGITIWWTHDQTKQPGKVPAKTQIIAASAAFAIWVLALQGTDIQYALTWYRPAMGSLVLFLYSTIVARKVPKED